MGIKVNTFLYHEVVDKPFKSGFGGKSAQPYKHSKREFGAFLDILRSSPIKPVKLYQIDFASTSKYILLTFDDGGISNLYVADELEKNGFYGHFFIPTEFIGSPHFMSKSNICDLYRRGHIIGSHSHSHPSPFYLLSSVQMRNEWKNSIERLSEIIGSQVDLGSIPGGEMDYRSQVIASESGLRFLFTSLPKLKVWSVNGMKVFGRVCPKSGTSLKHVEKLAKFDAYLGENLKWSAKRYIRKTLYGFKKGEPSAPAGE